MLACCRNRFLALPRHHPCYQLLPVYCHTLQYFHFYGVGEVERGNGFLHVAGWQPLLPLETASNGQIFYQVVK